MIPKGPQVQVERPIRRPSLSELETFVIAARGGSLASAARRLRISTPAVAKRIESLEATVGHRLLERGRSGVRLTDEGRRLVPHAERLLDRSDDLLDDLAVRHGDSARIRGVRGLLGSRAPSTEAVLSETEALLAQIFHLSSNGIFVARPADLHLYDVNEAFCSMLAYRRDELLRRPASAVWADPAGGAELARRALEAGGAVRDLTVELVARDGTPRVAELSAFLLRVGGERRLLATVRDVTDRVVAERRTARHIRREQAVADLGLLALRGATLDELLERATALANDELNGLYTTIAEYDPEFRVLVRRAVHGPAELELDSLPQTLKVDARPLLEPGEPFIIKNLRSRGDLDPEAVRRFDLHSSIVGVIRGRDAPFGMLAVQSQRVDAFTEDDVIFVRSLANTLATAIGRIHVDASVGALEAGLAAIVRWSQDAILSASLDGVIFSWNEAAERMFGYTAAEAVGSSVEILMAPDRVAERRQLVARIAANEGVESFVTQRVAKDGRILDVSLSLSPVRSPDGEIVGASAIMRDLTAQMQLEAELGRVERLHSAVVENMRSSVLVLDLESTIVFANRAAHSLLGFAAGELIGRSITEFGQGAPEAVTRERFDQGRVSAEVYESTLRHADGSEVPVSVSTTPLLLDDGSFAGAVALVEDISERLEREAERGRSHALAEAAKEQLRRAARMEAVARMAGGVAHDFNNIVMGIVGYAQLTLAGLDADDPARTYLAEILRGTDDAVALISQFTAFGRGEQLNVRPIDLNAAISEIGRLLEIVIGADVKLDLRLAPRLPLVEANLGTLEQVVLNVASNARDAMPHGGRFSIETAEVVLEESAPASHGEMSPGQYVVLTLADDGVGMDAETQQMAFEPFFTTKAAEGSGLGLASVYGTVRQLNGQVSLSSEPERGTTLSIYLPALSRQRRVLPERPGAMVAGGSETILLAEDDDQIRTLVARVLSDKGYRVLVAASGEEALELARGEPDEINLLITDVVMGAMSGTELADRLRAERPSISTLITSGYPDVPNARDARIVGKPYGPLELAQHVRSVLGTPRRTRRVEVTR